MTRPAEVTDAWVVRHRAEVNRQITEQLPQLAAVLPAAATFNTSLMVEPLLACAWLEEKLEAMGYPKAHPMIFGLAFAVGNRASQGDDPWDLAVDLVSHVLPKTVGRVNGG